MSAISSMVTTDPLGATPVFVAPPAEIAPGVLMLTQFSNSYAIKTRDGLLLVDTGTARMAGRQHDAIRGWTELPLHTVIYTHGHLDHVCGLAPFKHAGATPRIIAQENGPARFQRYLLTHGLNDTINSRQFGTPAGIFPSSFDYPTETFRDRLQVFVGDLDVRLTAGKGETDDHLFVWLPERAMLFTGDFIIWRAPNCGNPQKVQRYPVEWVEALEKMAALDAEWLCPGHGLVVHGRAAVRQVLTDTAAYLRHIIDQVLPRLNAGEEPESIVHAVTSDPGLAARPYLRELYDHPQFIVRNLIRLWGGWWNGNAADLMPATLAAQGREIVALAGGMAPLIARARALLAAGDLAMASHLAEWAVRAAPANPEAQALKRDVYDLRLAQSPVLMVQGIYRAAANEARTALGEEVATRPPPSPGGLL